jgi:phosphohistidine phosphatase
MDSDADRTLMVLRHGHAARPTGDSDFDRPLSQRGQNQIRALAEYMKSAGHQPPDLILCSSARRTQETAQTFIEHTGWNIDIVQTRSMYLAYVDEVLDTIAGIPASVKSLMVVGHNPGFEHLVGQLAGKHVKFKTGTLAVFKYPLDMEWSDIPEAGSEFLGAFRTGRST